MSFGKNRYGPEEWELVRFATKLNSNVIGGASKLFSAFVKSYNPKNVKTFADLRHSDGRTYEILGFVKTHVSKPNYFYFKEGTLKLESRISYQKHKLKKSLKRFDSELTESENMYENGYRKIYDCGSLAFVWSNRTDFSGK